MNERIEELAVQAGVTGHFAAGTELATPIPLSPEMEKFAELIVNQCADIAQQHNKSPVAAPLAIGYVIREHFGVTE
jgi:hypothetical protein